MAQQKKQNNMNAWSALLAMNEATDPNQAMMSVGEPAKLPEAKPAMPQLQMPQMDLSKLKLDSLSIPVQVGNGASQSDKEYEALIKKDIEQRRGGIEGMQKQLDNLEQKEYGIMDADLSGLGVMADALRGQNLAGHYKAPGTRQKDLETAQKLKEAMAKQQGEITDDMVSILKNSSDKEYQRALMGMGRQQRFDESLDLKREDNLRKDVNKVADEYNTVQGQFNMAEQAVKQGDTRTVSMVISSIARNIGEQKGSLSDGDVARSLPPDIATSVAGLEAYLGSNPQVSPQLQNALLGLINLSRQKSNAIYEESLNRRKSAYSAGSYSPLMQKGKVGDVIFGSASKPLDAQPPVPQPPPTKVINGKTYTKTPAGWEESD